MNLIFFREIPNGFNKGMNIDRIIEKMKKENLLRDMIEIISQILARQVKILMKQNLKKIKNSFNEIKVNKKLILLLIVLVRNNKL